MSDNLNRRRPEDYLKINIHQVHEVRYWTKKLGVSETFLRKAVEAVGPEVGDVRLWINKRKAAIRLLDKHLNRK